MTQADSARNSQPKFEQWPEANFFLGLLHRRARRTKHSAWGPSGSHVSARAGAGSEFLDHRAYVPGDDVRNINWSVFARTGHPIVRTFQTDTAGSLRVVVDASASMGVGTPSKLHFAWRLAVAFTFSAYAAGDPVRLFAARDGLTPIAAGQATPQQQAEAVAALSPTGATDMAAVVAGLKTLDRNHKAQLVLISDFFDARGIEPALLALGRPRLMPVFVQVEAPEDADPAAFLSERQRFRVRDMETGREIALPRTATAIETYQSRRRSYNEALSRRCQNQGVRLLLARSDGSFEATALKLLRQSGFGT